MNSFVAELGTNFDFKHFWVKSVIKGEILLIIFFIFLPNGRKSFCEGEEFLRIYTPVYSSVW